MESIPLANFQNLPLEIQYEIAQHWSLEEVGSVLEHYRRPLNEYEKHFRRYLEYLQYKFKVWSASDLVDLVASEDLEAVRWKVEQLLKSDPSRTANARRGVEFTFLNDVPAEEFSMIFSDAADMAIKKRSPQLFRLIYDSGIIFKYDVDLIRGAASRGDIEMVEMLYQYGFDLDFGVVENAVKSGNIALLEWLMNMGVNFNERFILDAASRADPAVQSWFQDHSLEPEMLFPVLE